MAGDVFWWNKKPPARALAPMLALGLTLASAQAGADELDECEVGPDDVGLAFVFPERACKHNVHIDMRLGTYRDTHDTAWRTLFSTEFGLLERLGDNSRFQLGPVVAIGGSGQTQDWEESFDEWFVSPRLRLRYWMFDEWMTLEAAAGPNWLMVQDDRGDWLKRAGGYLEIGPTVHGLVGFYVGQGYTPPSDGLPGDWRTTFGLRVNLTAGALGAMLGGALYACGKAPAAC